jgi:hypothetical protein
MTAENDSSSDFCARQSWRNVEPLSSIRRSLMRGAF